MTAGPQATDRPTANLTTGLVYFIKAFVGPGCLSLPLAFQDTGLGLGLVVLLCIALLVTFNLRTMVLCKQHLAHKGVRTYADLAQEALGTWARRSVELLINGVQLGICAVYFDFFAENARALLPDRVLRDPPWWASIHALMALVFPVYASLALLKSVDTIAPYAALANALIYGAIGVVLFAAVNEIHREYFGSGPASVPAAASPGGDASLSSSSGGGGDALLSEAATRFRFLLASNATDDNDDDDGGVLQDETPSAPPQELQWIADWTKVPMFYSTVVYSFEGVCSLLPVENALARPRRDMPTVTYAGMCVVTFTYAAVGAIAYAAWPSVSSASVTAEVSKRANTGSVLWYLLALFANVATVVAVVLTFPVQLFPSIELLEATFGLAPRAATHPSSDGGANYARVHDDGGPHGALELVPSVSTSASSSSIKPLPGASRAAGSKYHAAAPDSEEEGSSFPGAHKANGAAFNGKSTSASSSASSLSSLSQKSGDEYSTRTQNGSCSLAGPDAGDDDDSARQTGMTAAKARSRSASDLSALSASASRALALPGKLLANVVVHGTGLLNGTGGNTSSPRPPSPTGVRLLADAGDGPSEDAGGPNSSVPPRSPLGKKLSSVDTCGAPAFDDDEDDDEDDDDDDEDDVVHRSSRGAPDDVRWRKTRSSGSASPGRRKKNSRNHKLSRNKQRSTTGLDLENPSSRDHNGDAAAGDHALPREDHPPWGRRVVFRVAVVLVIGLAAALVPDLGALIALIGALTGSALSLVIPSLIDIACPRPGRKRWELVLDVVVCAGGVLGGSAGTVQAVLNVLHGKGAPA